MLSIMPKLDGSIRVRIRDDGNGIPQSILKAGREDRNGLAGMRERARQIGAKLNSWSRVGAGTEVELNVPGSIACAEGHERSELNLFRGKAG